MMTPQRELLAFIELNQPVAIGTIRDGFPQWDIEGILHRLELAGQVAKETRPTTQGNMTFYHIKKKYPGGWHMNHRGNSETFFE